MFFLQVASGEITSGDIISSFAAIGLGIGVIFVVLLLRRLTGGSSGKAPVKDTKPENEPAVKKISEPAVELPDSTNDAYQADDGALIAVLTAAIIEYNKATAAVYSEGSEFKGLRIVSFKERNRII